MRIFLSASLFLTVISASAQTVPIPVLYQPLGQVQQYLQLTDAQLQTILSNNGDYDQYASMKQSRISQVQGEIAIETAKETLDPMALGVRYAEIEGICRELKSQALTYQQKNTSVLTDPQKAKLQVLVEAVKLAPVISDAQAGNLIGTPAYSSAYFTSTSYAGFLLGSVGGIVASSGCYSPFPPSVRIGDFTPGAANGTVVNRSKR